MYVEVSFCFFVAISGERDTVMKHIIFRFPVVFWKFIKCKWEVDCNIYCNIIKLCNIINSLYFDLVRIAIAR